MSNQQPYQVLSAPLVVQTEVKRSKFIAYAAVTSTVAAAKEFIAQIKQRHPDANHNCWAFVAGRPENTVDIGYSDDGEPSGCAGRPMLNVLQGSQIGEITVVVTRYFGGIKLGTGGMARAYGGAVSALLAQASSHEKTVPCILVFDAQYTWSNTIDSLVAQYNASILNADYGENISYQVSIDVRQHQAFIDLIHQRTSGQVSATVMD